MELRGVVEGNGRVRSAHFRLALVVFFSVLRLDVRWMMPQGSGDGAGFDIERCGVELETQVHCA